MVIIDEVHAVAGGKRGAHLALSLERLDALLHTSAQRIGLSRHCALSQRCGSLSGGDCPVTVVDPPAMRHPRIGIVVPVANMDDVSIGRQRHRRRQPCRPGRLHLAIY
ncbi:hypothetical protein ACULNC_12955 [Shigella flexneri]